MGNLGEEMVDLLSFWDLDFERLGMRKEGRSWILIMGAILVICIVFEWFLLLI